MASPTGEEWWRLVAASAFSALRTCALDAARKRLIAKAAGQCDVHWSGIIRAARAPGVDRSTAVKGMKAAGYDIQWRSPRQKLVRGDIDEDRLLRICGNLRKKPVTFWTAELDAIVDNTPWPIPRSVKGRAHLKRLRSFELLHGTLGNN